MAAIGRQTHHEPIKGVGAAIGAHTHHPPPTLVLGASGVADEVDVLLTEQGVLAEVGEQLQRAHVLHELRGEVVYYLLLCGRH